MLSETEGDTVIHRFSASDGPMCLRGSEYTMSTRDTGSEDLVIFLQGGGACWDTLCAATETATPGIPKVGMLDPDVPGNPIADMNIAYLPYCDGGVHASDAEYDVDGNGIMEPGTTDQFHHGLHNLSASLDVTVQAFPSPRRIVLMGVSGGGFGTIDVVNDSGVSVGRPNEPEFFEGLLSYWNIKDSFLPASCPECIAEDGHGTGVHSWGLEQDENLRLSLLSHKLGLERGLSVALFPMVILTMTIERLSITWEERGGGHAFKVALGTLVAATLAHLLMSVPELVYFVFTFPAVLMIMVGFMLAMGRYRGYRLTELFRFKAFLKD